MSPEDSNPPQPDLGESAADGPADVGETSAPGGPRIGRSVLVALLIVAAAGGSYFAWEMWQARNELPSADALRGLGVIVVMDSNGKHVFSVNLSMPQVRDNMAEAMRLLPDLYYVENIDLSDSSVTDEHLENLAGLKRIASLSLNDTQIGNAGLAQIAGLSSLQAVYLINTNVTRDSLVYLGGLPELKILDLTGSKVDGDLAALKGAKNLDWLLLAGLNVSDAAIDTLIEMPNLGRVTLAGSQVNAEAVKRLEVANPELLIDVSTESVRESE